MHVRNLGEALKMIMEQRGWSQTRLGREIGQSQDWVSDVIRGRRGTYLKRITGILDKVGWEVHITPKAEEDDPVKRREFVAGAASIMFVRSPKTTPFHDPAYVDRLTQQAIQINNEIGGASLGARLLKHAKRVSSATLDGGRELHFAASEYMRRGSYIFRTASQRDTAILFANNALLHAKQSGDPDQQASAYFALGLASAFKDNLNLVSTNASSHAIMFAQHGLQTPEMSDETRAYLNCLLACGLAAVPGRERQARAAVERALNIDTLPVIAKADIIGWSGNALRATGAHSDARKMLEEAVTLSAPYSQAYPAWYLSDQVMIALDMREPSRTASLMNTFSRILPFVDSAMLDVRVDRILRASKPWETVPEVREARERLQSMR